MLFPSYLGTLKEKEHEIATKKGIYDKTLYVWINHFTPAKKILHNSWLWWLSHLEGLQCIIIFDPNCKQKFPAIKFIKVS